MSQNSKEERVRRSESTGSYEQGNTEDPVMPSIHCLLKCLQQLPNLDSAVEEANKIERGIPKLRNNNKELKKKITEQEHAMDQMSQKYEGHLEKKNVQIARLKGELEETRVRLSKLMALRMTDNNPNIADLSDPNRPTKLAERYGELYDNEWTDAFEMLTKNGMDEKAAIYNLQEILTKTYKYCRIKCESLVETFEEAFTMMPKDHQKQAVSIPEEVLTGFKDYRKVHADIVVELSLQDFLDGLRKSNSELAQQALSLEKFLTSCFRLCWMMSIQDPPIYLDQDTSNGDQINKENYRHYTVTGTKIDYIVWPCIYIEKGGALLHKGVAQCYPNARRPVSAAARLTSQGSEEDNVKERPKTAYASSNEIGRKNQSNQPQKPIAGLNDQDSSVPGHVAVSEHERSPTDEASAAEQTMERGNDEIDCHISSGAPKKGQVSKTVTLDHQTNTPVETVEFPSASVNIYLPEDPVFKKEIIKFLRYNSNYGHKRAKRYMGNECYQRCMDYCNANNVDGVNLEQTSSDV